MERWSRGWQQIGGPNALAKWSWILTLPLALVISNVYAQTPTPSQVALWLGIALLVHCILGVLMWLAWVTVLSNRPRRSRPITAVIVFAALGTVRGLLMQTAQDFTGIGGTEFLERMGVNVLGSIVVLSAIAIVVDDFRTDADIKARLEEANRTLAAVRDQEEAALRAADRDVLDRVQAAVEAALSESGATPERSRQVSEEIVRPISHELAEARFAPALILDPPVKAATKLTFTEAFAATAAPSPLAVALLLETAAFGAVLGGYGLFVALTNFILGGAAIYLGGCAFRRFVPLPRQVALRVLAIAIGFAVVGGASSFVVPALINWLVAPFNVQILGPIVATAAAALAVTLGTAVISGRRHRLDALAESVAESAASIELLNTRMKDRQTQAARFLHGPIQGELVAAAVRGDSPDDARQAVSEQFRLYGTPQPERKSCEQYAHLIDAWSSVLTITQRVDEDVWQLIEASPLRGSLLLEALAEGLTNTIRHSSSLHVDIDLGRNARQVYLRLASRGSLHGPIGFGLGLRQIERSGAAVSLTSDGMQIFLLVVL